MKFAGPIRNELLALAFGLLLIVLGLTTAHVANSQRHKIKVSPTQTVNAADVIDLLAQDWSYMPGVSREGDGLHIRPTNFRIVEQDGSGGQANPPLNLYGTHLATKGDFLVTTDLKNVSGNCSVQLYGQPPLITDEFRVEPASIRVTVTANSIDVQVWNGKTGGDLAHQQPTYHNLFAVHQAAAGPITISSQTDSLIVTTKDQQLASIADARVFGSGQVWLGLDSSDAGCTVSGMKAAPLAGGNIKTMNAAVGVTATSTSDGLQALANQIRPGFTVGAAMALGPLVSDASYTNEALKNFGGLTPENAMKWQFIEPQKDQFTFQEADALVAIARKHGMSVHGHTLVFSEANPRWVQDLPTTTAADKQAVQDVMLKHVSTVVKHYQGKVATWDVVNEPLADYGQFDAGTGHVLRDNKWYQAMGSDYIAQALRAAHQADPQAKLYINEYGLESDGERWDAFVTLVSSLKTAGLPLDGVGFQAHVYTAADTIDPAVLRQHFDQLAALGLSSRISEMDVYDDDGSAVQAQQYSAVFHACLADTHCLSFTTWGVDDRYDVFQDDQRHLQYGHDLLFDKGLPTAVYPALRTVLGKP